MREALAMVRDDYSEDEVVIVSNHVGDEYGSDYTQYRREYCDVIAFPTGQIDYIHSLVTWSMDAQEIYDWLVPRIEIQLAKSAPGTLEIACEREGDTVTLHSTVTLDTSLSGVWRLWNLVFEEEVDEYRFVVRAGNESPVELDISSPGESSIYDWGFDLEPGWEEDDLIVVAFIEKDFGDYEIGQAVMTDLDFSPAVREVSWGEIKAQF